MRTKGLTYSEVKSMLQTLTDQIPATDEQCQSYTVSFMPATDEKGIKHPDWAVLHARLKNMSIQLKVEYFELVSDKDAEGGEA